MEFKIEEKVDYIIFHLLEEKFDDNTVIELKSKFESLAKNYSNIILDLSTIKSCNTSGLSALLVGSLLFRNGNGKFIITNMTKAVEKLISHLPKEFITYPCVEDAEKEEFGYEQLAIAMINGKLRCISLFPDGQYVFTEKGQSIYNLLHTFSLDSFLFRQAIEEFEYLINSSKTTESELHNFFERNPDFILDREHRHAHSKIILNKNENELLIPDFILEPYEKNELSDLLELKLPKTKIYSLKKNRERFSSAVHEACAQLREYACFFDEEKNRQKIINKYGLHLYKPKLIVIIGRSKLIDPTIIRRIHGNEPGLTLKTYDQVLAYMKNKLKNNIA